MSVAQFVMSASASRESLAKIADEVARSLAYAQERGGQQQIVTPLLYPGGASVVLRLEGSPDGFFVSDYGAARREADMMGGQRIFGRIARQHAERYGVNFDSDLIFDVHVPRDALVTACVAVANASSSAVYQTAEALSERRAVQQKERLWQVLDQAFPGRTIDHNGSFSGRSETWDFDAVVMAERPVLFQLVSPNANSVNATVARFLDVKDMGADATSRITVATNLRQTPHLPLLSRTSKVIGIGDPAARFSSAALAA